MSSQRHDHGLPGISGAAIYLPRPRVSLESWCAWTGQPWPKVRAVVGEAFRMCPPDENAYTMAASAVMRLIRRYEVDPAEIGFLALGTESSTDNAAGAVIVRGMIDQALRAEGRAPLPRACEVPEFKHACLGGIYALKAALRWLALEGRGRRAIVVSADVAEYARNSSGEQTQGAGAVAFVLDARPAMLALDLWRAGSASAYRAVDFRKPTRRHFMSQYDAAARGRDFPVFNGRYSTLCYLDAVTHALEEHRRRSGEGSTRVLEDPAAIFFHRPYHHLPIAAFATAQVWSLVHTGQRDRFALLCAQAGVDAEQAWTQVKSAPDLHELVDREGPDHDPFSLAQRVVRALRAEPDFQAQLEAKLGFGARWVREFGNLYTASLPAWLVAGLSEAAEAGSLAAGDALLLVGYGSGDAAEAIPGHLVPGWREAASRVDLTGALADPIELDQSAYEALHDGGGEPRLEVRGAARREAFTIDRVGDRNGADFQDVGVEYYAWRPAKSA